MRRRGAGAGRQLAAREHCISLTGQERDILAKENRTRMMMSFRCSSRAGSRIGGLPPALQTS